MRILVTLLASSLAMSGTLPAQEPRDLGTTERSTVRLVVIDVVVVDRQGRTVPDLVAEDFEIVAGGPPIPIDTLDVDCPVGAADEPSAVARAKKRGELSGPDTEGKIVLAFDYLHLSPMQRESALEQAKEMVRSGGTGTDEVMVAALTGGIRVEQGFSRDPEQVLHSLNRMQYDVSLWNGNFSHLNEYGFTDGLSALLEVTGAVPGPKAVVLFSAMADVPLDLQFQQLAALAAASRCSIYPVDAGGLRMIEAARSTVSVVADPGTAPPG